MGVILAGEGATLCALAFPPQLKIKIKSIKQKTLIDKNEYTISYSLPTNISTSEACGNLSVLTFKVSRRKLYLHRNS
jgi:hypothetical protein